MSPCDRRGSASLYLVLRTLALEIPFLRVCIVKKYVVFLIITQLLCPGARLDKSFRGRTVTNSNKNVTMKVVNRGFAC